LPRYKDLIVVAVHYQEGNVERLQRLGIPMHQLSWHHPKPTAGLFGQCASAAGAFAGVTWRNSGTSNVAAMKASMMA